MTTLPYYLGEPVATGGTYEDGPSYSPPAAPAWSARVKDAQHVPQINAAKLGQFLQQSQRLGFFRDRLHDAVSASRAQAGLGDIPGAPLQALIDNFQPFRADDWQQLSQYTPSLPLREHWRETWDDGSARQTALDALLMRVAEEVVSAAKQKYEPQADAPSETLLRHTPMAEITNVLTAHPNGILTPQAEQAARQLAVDLLTSVQSHPQLYHAIGRWNGDPRQLPANPDLTQIFAPGFSELRDLQQHLVYPKKMTPAEERQRQRRWVRDSYDSLRSYMNRFQEACAAPADASDAPGGQDFAAHTAWRAQHWGHGVGYAPLAMLRMMRPPRLRSWVIGDADGKDATQPETIAAGIAESQAHVRELHQESLQHIAQILHENLAQLDQANTARVISYHQALQALQTVEDQLSAPDFTAAQLQLGLEEIKTRFEAQQVVFDRLSAQGTPANSFSKLDTLIVNVARCGDYYPAVEIRQNAQQQHEALSYLAQALAAALPQYAQHFSGMADQPRGFIQAMQNDPAMTQAVQQHCAQIYDRLSAQMNPQQLSGQALRDALPQLRQNLIQRGPDGSSDKRALYARQLLGIFQLAHRYPGAISSFVTAESAQLTEQEKQRMAPGSPARATTILQYAQRDYRQLMALESMTQPRRWQGPPALKFIPLQEDPDTMFLQPEIWATLCAQPDIAARLSREASPLLIPDPQTGDAVPYTVAHWRRAHGQEPKPGDAQIEIRQGPELMSAGSDVTGRGSAMMNLAIGEARREVEYLLCDRPPLEAADATRYIILPQPHAGVGAGSPRSQGVGNIASQHVVTQTTQGLQNVLSVRNAALDAFDYQSRILFDRQPAPASAPSSVADAHDASQPSYVGEYAVDRLSPALRQEMIARTRLCAAAREAMVYSEAFTDHLTHDVHGLLANHMNRSAREVKRDGDIKQQQYPAPTQFTALRIIGFVNRVYIAGDCGTETQVLPFFVPDPRRDLKTQDGVTLLGDENRKHLLTLYRGHPQVANIFAHTMVALTYANFDNAWAMAGLSREHADQGAEALVRDANGQAHTVAELAGLYQQFAQQPEQLRAIAAQAGLRPGHIALAEHERQYEAVARCLYELYFRLQHSASDTGDLRREDEKTLVEALRDFTPQKLYDLMPPAMQAQCRTRRAMIDQARARVTADHLNRMAGGPGTLNDDALYQLGTVHDALLESGAVPTATAVLDLSAGPRARGIA